MSVVARSYSKEQVSKEVRVITDTIIPEKVKNRTVVILDDILDTCKTMAKVIAAIEEHKPDRIITVFMI